ncbi:RNA polymerase subunit AC19 [Ophidiomyces ophidiicola]|nr:RNA polymerase subunit AC19 [Ophidiomyces ophidiicola]KAI1942575.1 RNA polymerase subunit AC19 [Ophidiomyces ophidiicola]KAI1964761.1 RNA polymerase subunit AC19 [Ophidiomyces ophidiicola]
MPAPRHSGDLDLAGRPTTNDTEMQDLNDGGEETGIRERPRITILPGSTETAASFEFEGEDHTLGNILRYTIMKNPEVEFCGYVLPHPSEFKMNLRIQTYDSTNVFEALHKGFDDLMNLCDVVTETFTAARDDFESTKMMS